MIEAPLISVIMPVYNAALYLHEAIESILNQDFDNFEFIIINDGSTDESESIILSYIDLRIKYVKNETNLKLIATLNKGLSIARGKYIARMDADDVSLPQRFEKQVEFLNQNPEFGLVGSNAKIIGQEESDISYPITDDDIKFSFIFFNPFIHSSVMIRKSVLDINGLTYDSSKLHVEDYDLWIKLLSFSKGGNIKENLVNYRKHDCQVSKVYYVLQKKNTNDIQLNYLISKGFSIKFATLIINLFDKETSIKIKDLIFLINSKVNQYYFSDFSINSGRLHNLVTKEAKNKILDCQQLDFGEFCMLLLIYRFFTLKQLLNLLRILIISKFKWLF